MWERLLAGLEVGKLPPALIAGATIRMQSTISSGVPLLRLGLSQVRGTVGSVT